MALEAWGVKFGWCNRSGRGELRENDYVGYGYTACLVCLGSVVVAGDWVLYHKVSTSAEGSGAVLFVLLGALVMMRATGALWRGEEWDCGVCEDGTGVGDASRMSWFLWRLFDRFGL